jgi:ribosomal protein L10
MELVEQMQQNELYGQMLGGKAKFWTGDMEVEQEALNQIRNISNLPILDGHIAMFTSVWVRLSVRFCR